MLFNSAIFLLLFVPACLAINLVLKGTATKNAFLLIASMIFYWFGEPVLINLLLLAIVVNYFAALAIQSSDRGTAKACLIATSFFNLSLLGWYKYSTFFLTNVNQLCQTQLATRIAGDLIPLGISFYIFHFISYTVDVYRKTVPAQRNPINVGLYVLFFPQLVAGPLVRYHYMAPQFANRHLNSEMFSAGFHRFITGLAKKCLIADPLGRILDPIFRIPGSDMTTHLAWVAIIAFIFQLYFDFSGYADIAIGLAKMLGFRLPENFNKPLLSKSATDFWGRWHIQLGQWMQQYLYIPVGRKLAKSWPTKNLNDSFSPSTASEIRTCLNTGLFFLIIGLWHGASWNFVWFGVINGLIVICERLFLIRWLQKLPAIAQHAYFWFILSTVMLLFRTENTEKAFHYLAAMLGLQSGNAKAFPDAMFISPYFLFLLAASVLCCIDWQSLAKKVKALRPVRLQLYTARHTLRLCTNIPLYALCLGEVAAASQNPFLYFKF
jgi:alginate O-acetyltransferase complex protein AlgI